MTKCIRFLLASSILLLFFSVDLLAQTAPVPFTAKNAAYLEIGGNGIVYSFNYERIFFQKGIFKSAARAGLTLFPLKRGGKNHLTTVLPIEIIGMLGRSKHHLELGIGISPNLIPYSEIDPATADYTSVSYEYGTFIPFRIGYRYQKSDGGFFFRAGYTPILDFPNKYKQRVDFTSIHGGISVGKSF